MSESSAVPVVNSFDEWTRLSEVIVGSSNGLRAFHLDPSFNLFYWENIRGYLKAREYFRDKSGSYEWPIIPLSQNILNELAEDIQGFVETLSDLGIVVRRPLELVGNGQVQTPFWRSIASPPLNVRDQTLILGSNIVETAPQVRGRLFENDYLKPVFLKYMELGARWLCMPRPTLSAGTLDLGYFSLTEEEQSALVDYHALELPGIGREILFDGAQCIRLGRDVLVNVANKSHELGLRWLSAQFGDTFQFHRLDGMADSHIDSTILPLRAGVWLARDKGFIDKLPGEFRRWDVVVAPEPSEDQFPSYEGTTLSITSRFIDMNVLSIDERTVIANSLSPELVHVLEHAGFAVIPVRNRHRRICGGGFHCFTLDVRRSGGLESYR